MEKTMSDRRITPEQVREWADTAKRGKALAIDRGLLELSAQMSQDAEELRRLRVIEDRWLKDHQVNVGEY
jgi:hypothetical protein